jgi:hypothetical protein
MVDACSLYCKAQSRPGTNTLVCSWPLLCCAAGRRGVTHTKASASVLEASGFELSGYGNGPQSGAGWGPINFGNATDLRRGQGVRQDPNHTGQILRGLAAQAFATCSNCNRE